MNSRYLGEPLLDILEINLSTTPSIKLVFIYMFSFLAWVRPEDRIRSMYSYHCVRGPYPKTDGKSRKVAIMS
jgi:hypothetical protein